MFTKGKCRYESRAMKRAEKKQKVEAVTANTKSVGSFVLSSSSESQAKMTVQTQ